MKTYKEYLTLVKNARKCFILDTVKGCPGASLFNGNGCYDDCYAKRISSRYGFNFENVMIRRFSKDSKQLYFVGFEDNEHLNKIIREIKKSGACFIRIGEMGDPSANWEHTFNVCEQISTSGEKIVIITKHWKEIGNEYLDLISRLGLYINTSISALDTDDEIEYRLNQYKRLKDYCHSILRVVTCEFNLEHSDGFDRNIIQSQLLKNENVIETIFRPRKDNYFVKKGIIKTKMAKFLNKESLASIRNDDVYFGYCDKCPDQCGIGGQHGRQNTRSLLKGTDSHPGS